MAAFISNYINQISSDLSVCPDVKVMMPNGVGSLSSALEKRLGNQTVVIFMTAGRSNREQLQSSAELTPDSLSSGHYRLHTHTHRSCVKEAYQRFLFGRVSCTTPARAYAVHDPTMSYRVSNSPDEFWCVLDAG